MPVLLNQSGLYVTIGALVLMVACRGALWPALVGAVGAFVQGLAALLAGEWPVASVFWLLAGALVVAWWRRRQRKRRRLAKLAGYKAKAVLAAMGERAREVAQPRPVLVPGRVLP